MTTQWGQEEVDEILDSEGGGEAGMGSLGDYKACLQYFTEHAAKAASTKHWAKRSWRPRIGRGATGGARLAKQSPSARAPRRVCGM